MKSAKKAASTKPVGSKKRASAKGKKSTKKAAGRVGFTSEALEGADAGKVEVQVAALLGDVQRIFLDAARIHEAAPEAVVEIPTADLVRLAGVTLALAHQCHEIAENDHAKIVEGAWTIVAALVQKHGTEIVVTSEDLEATTEWQLDRKVSEAGDSITLALTKRETNETDEAEKAEGGDSE